nr:MAG TPA: hypothetical protein [Caudoviricetes sp.]
MQSLLRFCSCFPHHKFIKNSQIDDVNNPFSLVIILPKSKELF